jgi:adenosylmethionine-8-amino-7-oxononanoate transaminase
MGKSMNNNDLESLDKKHVWHPFTQMQDWQQQTPLIIDKGIGNYLYDINGKKYLDGISSLWVNVHGHQKKEITDAITKQANKISHSTLLGSANTPSIILAEKLAQITPQKLEKIFYSDSGSTAVEIALKMTYQYWQQQESIDTKKKKFITFNNAYHGDTIGSVSVGGIDLFHKKYKQLLFDTINLNYPNCYHCSLNKDSCNKQCFKDLETTIKKNHKETAGLIIEPLVQGASGILTAVPGFLKDAEKLCNEYDIILITDEVATGFGKTGKMFACEHENVTPDIMTVAKGITGGYLPLAATMTNNKIYNAFLGNYEEQKTFFHGHSYTGNQLACAAGIANIDLFEQENIIEDLQPKITQLQSSLSTLSTLEHVGDIRSCGIMCGIELVKEKETRDPYPWEEKLGVQVCDDMITKGFLLRPLGNVIVFMPPLSITNKEIIDLISSLSDSIKKITE